MSKMSEKWVNSRCQKCQKRQKCHSGEEYHQKGPWKLIACEYKTKDMAVQKWLPTHSAFDRYEMRRDLTLRR